MLEQANAARRMRTIGDDGESFRPPNITKEGANGRNLLRQGFLIGVSEDLELD